MCNESIRRDPRGKSVGSDMLGNATNKIKDTMMQIYDHIGKSLGAEMALSDAYHKFSTAFEQSVNNEDAMQGNRRKVPFPEQKYERLTSSSVVCA
eukprot:15329588-Ditylum_brightwellii.AAC.1